MTKNLVIAYLSISLVATSVFAHKTINAQAVEIQRLHKLTVRMAQGMHAVANNDLEGMRQTLTDLEFDDITNDL